MNTDSAHRASTSEIAAERTRLTRLCASLTGDPLAAEDLVQETLLAAWRHEQQLRDPQKRAQWLSGIARNLSLQWIRRRRLEASRFIPSPAHGDASAATFGDEPACEFDLEMELERDELAELLDRALVLLPPDTRAVLIERYIRELPRADIAARLRLPETTVAKRLERGRHALRSVLVTTFADEAATYGLRLSEEDGWQETRIWCPHCGHYRLKGVFLRERGDFQLRCPGCCTEPGVYVLHHLAARVLAGIKSFKPAVSRLLTSGLHYYGAGLERGLVACPGCRRDIPLHMHLPESAPLSHHGERGVHYRCSICDLTGYQRLTTRSLGLPEAQRFWRAHPRIVALPQREVEAAGQPAIVVGFQAIGTGAELRVVVARNTYRVLAVYGAPDG